MHVVIAAPTLSSEQKNYLTRNLQAVSRSFALVVPFLEEPLQHYLAAAYLLCRVVDNIEDSGQTDDWKIQRFAEFSRLLNEPHHAVTVLSLWEQESWYALTEQEREMMTVAGGLPLWEIFAGMPQPTQATVRLWTGIMAEGMKQLSDSQRRISLIERKGYQLLESEADYNDYCYYVAGTVGHMVTELVTVHYAFSQDTAHPLRARAKACGRALQKTNIVKDFIEDLERGICYLPAEWLSRVEYAPLDRRGASNEWREMVLADVLNELRDATDYLADLPYTALGYRRAALLCLLPAYQTMLAAARNHATLFTPAHQAKISRPTMAQCLADAERFVTDNSALRAYTRQVESEIHAQFHTQPALPVH